MCRIGQNTDVQKDLLYYYKRIYCINTDISNLIEKDTEDTHRTINCNTSVKCKDDAHETFVH